jgi:hypothetical protein
MRRKSMYVPLAALAVAHAAAADDSGWYVGAGVGAADTANNVHLGVPDVPLLSGKTDGNETSWGFAAGYRFNPYLAFELGYVDLGEIEADVVDATALTDAGASVGFSAAGATFAMIGTFPMAKWELYLKAGVFFSSPVLEYSGSLAGEDFRARITNDSNDPLYGIGVKYALSEHLQIFLDSTYFMEVGEPGKGQADFLNTSLGASWRF